MNLFIDTTNWKLIYLLEDNEQIIDFFILENIVKTSDLAIEKLQDFLTKNNLQLSQIQNFYLTTGPGSYTGIRVGMTIVKTIKTLNSQVNVYLINSLLYQAGLKKTVSILDAKGQKSYLGIYEQGKAIAEEVVVLNSELESLIKKYQDQEYLVYRDYQDLDFQQNYLVLKSHFQLAKDVEDIEPLYIKSFL